MVDGTVEALVTEYLKLGLGVGRHVEGLVDAYYGPRDLADEAAAGLPESPAALAERGRRLLGELAVDADMEAGRRAWLTGQTRGLHTTARKLAGEPICYLDEIEDCYGVRPGLVPEDDFSEAHKRIDEVLPGSGSLADRYVSWREQQFVAADVLGRAIDSLADDFRERTGRAFGLPEGEQVEFELVTQRPWSGFNYYLGGLHSRVAVNIDLPVLSTSLGPLVAHEAYPGHHTEHCRKEIGLVRQRSQLEETIFLVGTPQCLVAEGLADLGLEVIAGRRPEPVIAEHMKPLGVGYDADLVGHLSIAGEALGAVRGNAAILIHDQGMDAGEAVDYVARWSLLPRPRAEKVVEFLVDPTWRAYAFCYIEGLRLCRRYVSGDPARFERLVTEQVTTSELSAS